MTILLVFQNSVTYKEAYQLQNWYNYFNTCMYLLYLYTTYIVWQTKCELVKSITLVLHVFTGRHSHAKIACSSKFYLWYSSFLTSCLRAPNHEWVPIFLVHSIETRVFSHSTCVFKFVGRHGFTSVRLRSNSRGMHCEYITSSDSSLRVHTSSSHALLEQ